MYIDLIDIFLKELRKNQENIEQQKHIKTTVT